MKWRQSLRCPNQKWQHSVLIQTVTTPSAALLAAHAVKRAAGPGLILGWDCKVRNTNPESQFWELFPGTCRIIPDVPHLLPSRAACGSQWPHIVPYPWGDHSTYCWQLWIRNCFTGREGVLGVAFSHQPRNHCFLHSSLIIYRKKTKTLSLTSISLFPHSDRGIKEEVFRQVYCSSIYCLRTPLQCR